MILDRTKKAFTLIELTVSIAIIAILLAIAIPAISYSREISRRSKCTNNIRNVALATLQYVQQTQSFPAGIRNYGTHHVDDKYRDPDDPENYILIDHHKIGPWHIALLPFFGDQNYYQRWVQDHYPFLFRRNRWPPKIWGIIPSRYPNVSVLKCPSAVTGEVYFDDRTQAYSHLTANVGCYSGSREGPAIGSGGKTIGFAESMTKANGMFHNWYSQEQWESRSTPVGPILRMRDIHDGTTQTILYSETAKPFPFSWLHGGPVPLDLRWFHARGKPGEYYRPEEHKYVNGFVWHHVDEGTAPIPEIIRINGGHVDMANHHLPIPSEERKIDGIFWLAAIARPSSNHAQGVNMAFADGRVKFVSETVSYRVYQAVMTPFGSRSDVPFKKFRLQEF